MTPGRVAAHRPHLALGEPGDHALGRRDDDVVLAARDVDPGELVVVVDRDRPDPGRADALELLERRLLDVAAPRRHDEEVAGLEVRQDDRRDRDLAGLDLDARQVDDRGALRLAAGVDDRVDLRAEHPAAVREEQRPVVGVGDDEVLDRVLLARDVADDPLAAAVLAAIRGDRLALDVAAARRSSRRRPRRRSGPRRSSRGSSRRRPGSGARRRTSSSARASSSLMIERTRWRVGEDVLELGDQLDDREVLVLDLLALEGGEAGEPHVEDRLGLELRQLEASTSGSTWPSRRRATRGSS